jgi:hypothetical protein
MEFSSAFWIPDITDWWHQPDGAAELKLSERSRLPPPLSAKDLPGGQIQILNVCRIQRINCHPVKSDEDSTPESISDTEDWLDWNGDLDNPKTGQIIWRQPISLT